MRNKCHSGVCWWRLTILTICVVWLSGCASIPAALQQASWVLSGGSYIATGKGPSDHVISIVVKKDCSLLRILLLKPICVPVSEESNRSLLSRLFGKPKNSLARPDIHDNRRIVYVDHRIARVRHRIGVR